ncbi:MAG: MFS transporter, partial [Halobacteriaceae archaeon]
LGRHGSHLVRRDVGLLLTANVIGATVTALVSPLLETLTGVYSTSPATIGLMVTAASAPAVFLIPVGGVLADRIGQKP